MILAGCEGPSARESRTSAAPAASPSASLAFELLDLDGRRATFQSFRGRVVVLDFWATWCRPCIAEIPANKALAGRLQKKGAELVGVVFDSGEPSEIRDFVREHGIAYRQVLGTQEMFTNWGAEAIPTTFVVDAEGAVRERIQGNLEGKFERIERVVDEALAARSPSPAASPTSPPRP